MSVTDAQRHALGERAREVMGDDEGSTLMEMLPPVGWADVTTKRDLDTFETRLEHSIEIVETRLEGAIDRAVVRLVMWLVPLNIGLAFGAARLAG